MVFSAGRGTKELGNRPWRDPHVALVEGSDKPFRALDAIKLRPAEAARWRKELAFILSSVEEDEGPPALRQCWSLLGTVANAPTSVSVRIVRHPTSQMKLLDAATEHWELPLKASDDLRLREALRKALAEMDDKAKALNRYLVFEEAEKCRALAFRKFLAEMCKPKVSVEDRLPEWRSQLAATIGKLPKHLRASDKPWDRLEVLGIRAQTNKRIRKTLEKMKGGET